VQHAHSGWAEVCGIPYSRVTGPGAGEHHYRGCTRLYAFNGFEPEIRYAVDPKWRNITPYVVLLDPQGRDQRVIGPPDAARLQAWLT